MLSTLLHDCQATGDQIMRAEAHRVVGFAGEGTELSVDRPDSVEPINEVTPHRAAPYAHEDGNLRTGVIA